MEITSKRKQLVIGLPKGRFIENSFQIIEYFCGSVDRSSRRLSYTANRPDFDLVFKFFKMPDIAAFLEDGRIDLGILCDEWAFEFGLGSLGLSELNWCQSSIALAISQDASNESQADTEIVATTFPRLARMLLLDKLPTARFTRLTGSAEGAVPELADAIVDCVESGSTLAANNLRPVHWLVKTNIRLVFARKSVSEDVKSLAQMIETISRKPNVPISSPVADELADLISMPSDLIPALAWESRCHVSG